MLDLYFCVCFFKFRKAANLFERWKLFYFENYEDLHMKNYF